MTPQYVYSVLLKMVSPPGTEEISFAPNKFYTHQNTTTKTAAETEGKNIRDT